MGSEHGELYIYANVMHRKNVIPPGIKYFREDIVCKYLKWAGKAGGLENCDMKPASSVMHPKAQLDMPGINCNGYE